MPTPNSHDLTERWLAENASFAPATASAKDYDSNGNAIETANEILCTLVYELPETAWPLLLKILKKASSDAAYALLAAGALEDLLARHGQAFIERIETEARRDPKFRMLLGGVWQNTMPEDIWLRVQKARGNIIW